MKWLRLFIFIGLLIGAFNPPHAYARGPKRGGSSRSSRSSSSPSSSRPTRATRTTNIVIVNPQVRHVRVTRTNYWTLVATPTPSFAIDETVQINEEVLPQEPLTSLVGVINGGNMRSEAQVVSQNVIGQVCPGDKVEIMEESDVWLKVLVQETTANCVEERVSSGTMGWIHSSLVLPPSSPLASPTLTPSPLASPTLTPSPLASPTLTPSPLANPAPVAKVFNGGNVRAVPGGEPILDQIHANEEVTLLQKRENGLWYRIRNQRNIEGWVHSSLLRIDPKNVTKVPIAR